jgi:polysaccharide deacetylase 2 family uncharacterized protein YibQ
MALRVQQAAMQALSDLGVAEEQLSVEDGSADGAGPGPGVWEAPLPPGVSLEKANLCVTNAVIAAEGRILDGREWRDRRKRRRCLTLIAAADSTPSLELRLFETTGGRAEAGRSAKKLAIVVGEMGRSLDDVARRLIESPHEISFAVLPGFPDSEETARLAGSCGKEVLLHLPMEPKGYPRVDPGPGAVLLDLSDREIRRLVKRHIEDLRAVSGVVNYMGSAGTRDRDLMRAVLEEMARGGLFFMDSSASAHSVGCETAAAVGVPCLQNDLFLEGGHEGADLLKKRMDRAERIALQRGTALVMASPTTELLEIISSRAGSYESKGIVLVRASDLIEN